MGLFSSRMTPEQLAKAKGHARNANQVNALAMDAINSGKTRADRERARKQLESKLGKSGADEAIKATEKNVRSWW